MDHRITTRNGAPIRDRQYVLYWMTASRRASWNFALQHAADIARSLDKPLLVYEPLACDYQWACDRFHQFVLDGMHDNAEHFRGKGVGYIADLTPERRLLKLARKACCVVTDDWPCLFLPRMVTAAAHLLDVRLDMVDSNGLFPMRATDRLFLTAASFRRFLDKREPDPPPLADPLKGLAKMDRCELPTVKLSDLPIDHDVKPTSLKGGPRQAQRVLKHFHSKLEAGYADDRNVPDLNATSGLSPYLHFGHISAHEIAATVKSPEFLDQLRTWREIGFNFCVHRKDYDKYDSLQPWAKKTLADHANDPREHLYTLEQFEQAQTHDELWNAAQNQLVREGIIHNYLRMLWGKKILEWTKSPREALAVMIELNNKYALDGRDPNSYCGIFWILGRYDRAWGPERKVFGKIRYMTSANTRRKTKVREYIQKYGSNNQTLFHRSSDA